MPNVVTKNADCISHGLWELRAIGVVLVEGHGRRSQSSVYLSMPAKRLRGGQTRYLAPDCDAHSAPKRLREITIGTLFFKKNVGDYRMMQNLKVYVADVKLENQREGF
jgi:hypothetical protein